MHRLMFRTLNNGEIKFKMNSHIPVNQLEKTKQK